MQEPCLRNAARELESAYRALAPAGIKKALAEDPEETLKSLASAKATAGKAAERANSALPRPSSRGSPPWLR